ncbi:MAG: bifunctional adenosylcobinamide kinase/adenosylcobinamide-phosphate guanylyltransferase [Thermodesulfobacteriota bacterium]
MVKLSIFRLALVLGGARSGKSSYALSLAESFPLPRLYVATCEPRDEEMQARIDKHQQERGPEWETREVCLDLADFLAQPPAGYGVILVDCLTMWLTNLMLKENARSAGIRRECARLAEALAGGSTPTILVSNEVGLGIVPDNPLAREYRDQAGWLHQKVAQVADLVVMMVAGLPLVIKGVGSKQ